MHPYARLYPRTVYLPDAYPEKSGRDFRIATGVYRTDSVLCWRPVLLSLRLHDLQPAFGEIVRRRLYERAGADDTSCDLSADWIRLCLSRRVFVPSVAEHEVRTLSMAGTRLLLLSRRYRGSLPSCGFRQGRRGAATALYRVE